MTRHPGYHGDLRDRMLEEARAMLLSSVDYESNLAQVGRLVVPALAEGCVIHLLEGDGMIRLLEAFHAEKDRFGALRSLHRREVDGVASEAGPWSVLQSGQPELLLDAGTHYLARSRDVGERQLLERLDLGSSVSAPMIFHRRLLGAITLFTSRYGRRLTERDLSCVQGMAQSAAGAVAHARLYRELERGSRLNDQLLTAFAHNLRNHLGSVHVWLELLRSEKLGPSGMRAVSMIDRSMRHLTELVSQLVDVFQIITGRVELDKQATDLPVLFDRILKAAETAAQDKRIRLEADIDRSLEWLWADPRRLRLAMENLISNAIKFTPPGGSVSVRLARRESWARIEVRDTGIGIPRELLATVLQGFRHEGGLHSGLGLAVARRIGELHGGRLGAESEGQGRGSVFVMDLPLDDAPASPTSHGTRYPGAS